ncbi:MAG: prepilin-type N-terminal cleavage/methylation domain-containing protein [Planctomycetota bacterium]
MTNDSQDGFTITELMITVAILAVFSATAVGLAERSYQEHAAVTKYQSDVAECRKALRSLEQHARAAQDVTATADGVVFSIGAQRIAYSVADGELRIRGRDGEHVISRCVASLDVSTRGRLVDLSITLRRRSDRPTKTPATIATSIAMRNWERSE